MSFKESDHPRDSDGEFTASGSSTSKFNIQTVSENEKKEHYTISGNGIANLKYHGVLSEVKNHAELNSEPGTSYIQIRNSAGKLVAEKDSGKEWNHKPREILGFLDSNRYEDNNEFLHVEECVLTGEEVAEYLGKEISGYSALGLEPNELYGVYRPAEEISKAAETFNNIPLTDNHIPITPDRPNQSKWLGTTGSNAIFKDGKLYNSVHCWTQRAKDYIDKADRSSGGKKDLSCGYAYDLVPEKGVFNGKHYDFKMVNLRGNHLALVEEGRNPDAMIADSINKEGKKVKKTLTQILLGVFAGDSTNKKTTKVDALKELLAMDSSDFQGGAEEQISSIRDVFNNLAADEVGRMEAFAKKEIEDEEPEDKEKAEDESPEEEEKKAKDKKAKDKKAADEESKEDIIEDESEEEEKKEKAMDAAIRVRDKVIALCNTVVGKMSDKFISDSSPEQMINATLNKYGLDTNKSLEARIAMLETLASTRKTKNVASDAKVAVSSDYKSIVPNRRG